MNIFNRELPKWSALTVTGYPVTVERAAEIIIRTDNWHLSSNDQVFIEEIAESFGLKTDRFGFLPWEEVENLKQELGVLDLEYLNNSRIVSAWVGGPHGWCNWDGSIRCCNYNIGKWPTIPQVYEEWERIAEAFPFLHLISRLFDNEVSVRDSVPIVEFEVKEGRVSVYEPEIEGIILPDWEEVNLLSRFKNPHGERGCTISQLQAAVSLVRSKKKGEV